MPHFTWEVSAAWPLLERSAGNDIVFFPFGITVPSGPLPDGNILRWRLGLMAGCHRFREGFLESATIAIIEPDFWIEADRNSAVSKRMSQL
jgi:hypothetical protein